MTAESPNSSCRAGAQVLESTLVTAVPDDVDYLRLLSVWDSRTATERLPELVEVTNFSYTINGCRIRAGSHPLPH